jgi:hypothetical protein
MNTPLSNTDILNKVDCKFLLYSNMHNIKSIRQLLPKTLILYQPADIGHFTCVFENDEGINYFDPFGYVPDIPLSWGHFGDYHDFTYLTKLLSESDEPIIYNEFHLQKMDTSTCGHWCALRLLYSDMCNDDFHRCFKNIKNKDRMIVKLFQSI